ncbi:MAG: beta-galactosidase trimerization domain-containing protein [Lentisphaeria bacterium]|nr:beta-galactosidase trimerization domain-containing protein [Lentisphaeria bacterium]
MNVFHKTLFFACTVIPLLCAAADDPYYCDRSSVVGFQPYKSTLPNKVLPTLAEQMQSYRMASYDVPLKLTAAEAAKQAKWYKEAGFNMVLAEKCRTLIMDLLPASARSAVRRNIDDTIRDSKMFFDAARKEGMQTMHHVTCTMVPMQLLKLHPEWAAVNLKSGKTEINTYGTGNTCINNDEYWGLWFARLKRLLTESPCDSVMIDEIQFFAPELCGCNSCRTKFKADTGYEMPPNGKYSGWSTREPEAFRRWRAWRIEKLLERQNECRKLIKSLNTDMVFSAYLCNNLTGYTRYAFGYDIINLPKYADSLGLESMPSGLRYPEYYPLVIMEQKLLRAVAEQTGNAPWVLFYAQDSFSEMVSSLTAFATGTRQWWWLLGKKEHVWRPMLQWEQEHEALVTPNENAGNIALYFSSFNRSLNPFGGSEWELGFSGVGNALTDENVPFRVIVEDDFKDAALLRKKADTVLAMNTAVWNKNALKEVEKFVRDGGTFITSGNFSMADEKNNKFPDFAAAKMLGFSYDGEIKSATALEVPGKNPVTGDFSGKIAYDKRIIKLKNIASDVKVYGSFIAKDGTSHPAILVRELGKGRIVYFAGSPERSTFFYFYNINRITPGQEWKDRRNPEWSRLWTKIAKSYNDKVVFEAKNFPAGVVIEALKHKNKETSGTMLTLLNFTSNRPKGGVQPQLRNYDFPSVAQNRPDKNAPMTLDIYAPGTKKVYLFSLDFDDVVDWKFVRNGDRIKVEIPELARHLVVYCSSGGDEAFALPGRKIVKELPEAKPLLKEILPALAAPQNPDAVIAFSDSAVFSGGVKRNDWCFGEPIRIIYGSRSNKTEMSVTLKVEKAMNKPILELGAMCDDVINSRAPIKIEFNGKTVFTGKAPYPDYRWSVQEFPLGVEKLEPGTYTVKITNTGNGPLNNVPWLGVAFCRIKPSGKTLDVKFKDVKKVPLSGKYIQLKGKFEKDAFCFGSEGTGARFPAKTLVGKEGAAAFRFRLDKVDESVKGDRNLLYLRPASLASMFFIINGKNTPKITAGFYHPVNKKGKAVTGKEVLEFGREYHAAAVWKDGKFKIYLDGKLLVEGDCPVANVKFNDLFIGPFQDSWLKTRSWNDSNYITELRTWNIAPEISEIFPQ